MNTCGAKTRDGDPCKNAQMANGRCRMHGGKIPQGIALPQTKDGRYSKHLPTRMLADYEQTIRDPELLDLADSIGLAQAKTNDLLRRVDHGDSDEWRQAILTEWLAFKAANKKKDAAAALVQMNRLDTLIISGADDGPAWDAIRTWEEHNRKLTESEQKRRVSMVELVSTEQVALMVRALTAAVRDHVHDPVALRAIADALARIAPGPVAGTD